MKKLSLIQACFWILLIYSIASIIRIFYSHPYFFEINNLLSPLDNISINLTFKFKPQKTPLVCFDDYCLSLVNEYNSGVYSLDFNRKNFGNDFILKPVKNYSLIYPNNSEKDFLNNIEDLYLYVGKNKYYYGQQDIKKFENKITQIQFDDYSKEIYHQITLPKNIKSNYRGCLNHCVIFFLSLFFNCNYFIFPYMGLFGCFLIYYFYSNQFNFKISNKIFYALFLLVVIINIFLRFYNIDFYPLSIDEIYTKTVAVENFSSCFKDAGNPGFFYIVQMLFYKLLPAGDFSPRLLSCIFGVCFSFSVFLFFKKFNKNFALFMMFFASMNIINISHSQNARAYSLCMLLGVLIAHFLIEYLNNSKLKNLVLYSILSLAAVHTHFMLSFFVFSNYVWGFFKLLKNKKEFIKFNLLNFLICASLIPYFLTTFKKSLSNNFNGWIEPLSINTLKDIMNFYFHSQTIFIIILIITSIYLISSIVFKNKINLEKRKIFLYLVYSIISVIFLASCFSFFVKPILDKRILLSLYGIFFLFEGVLILGIFKNFSNKTICFIKNAFSIILTFLFLFITTPDNARITHYLDNYIFFIQNDIKNYINNDFEIHALIVDNLKYLNNFDFENKDKIIWHVIDGLSGEYIQKIDKKELSNTNKKIILYLNNYATNIESEDFIKQNIKIYKTDFLSSGKIMLK